MTSTKTRSGRASTRTVPRRPGRRPSRRPPVLLLLVVAAVVGAGVAALVVIGLDDTPTAAAEDSLSPATVDGPVLPVLPDAGPDPAVGATAPTVYGESLDGDLVVAPRPGRPTVLLFLAHWCPHCQGEVPLITGWLEAGNLPDDVDLVAVSTSIDNRRPNYPPSAWLEDEGWPAPTVTDLDGRAADAFGLSAFPYWVVVDGDGEIVVRHSGRLSAADLEALVAAARSTGEGSA